MNTKQTQPEKKLWETSCRLRDVVGTDSARAYTLGFLFLRYLSDNYEVASEKELGKDYPKLNEDDTRTPLSVWYEANEDDVTLFEKQMRRKVHYIIKPEYLWSNIHELAMNQDSDLLKTLQAGFKHIENSSFENVLQGLFSEIDLGSEKLGKNYSSRNIKLCAIVNKISNGLSAFLATNNNLEDAYEYLIGRFSCHRNAKTGEFYTPKQISTTVARIVTADNQNHSPDKKKKIKNVLDFTCGSGSLLLNIRKQLGHNSIGQIYGQDANSTVCNIARTNMLLHGMKNTEFQIHCGDSLIDNNWDILNEMSPAEKIRCDIVVANPPFSHRWDPRADLVNDCRFKDYGLAPKSTADFAFLLHGFHFLSDEGTMAIVLQNGVLFRSGAEERIRTKLLKDGKIDTIICLPANLFFSTGVQVCIVVLKKRKTFDDILFIDASEHYEKGNWQNFLSDEHIDKIIDTYRYRKEDKQYSRRVLIEEIEKNKYNLKTTLYI